MANPLIQINDVVREMTDEEYAELLATGWTLEPQPPVVPDQAGN